MSLSFRSIALAVLALAVGVAASLAGIFIGEGQHIYAAKLAGGVVMAASLVSAFFILRGGRSAGAAPASGRNLGQAVLLVVDGIVLALVGWAIGEIGDAPGATLIAAIVLLVDMAAAVFIALRARRLASRAVGPDGASLARALAALLGLNGFLLMVAFWMIGAFLDPPGAPGIGALLLAVNMIVAIRTWRRK